MREPEPPKRFARLALDPAAIADPERTDEAAGAAFLFEPSGHTPAPSGPSTADAIEETRSAECVAGQRENPIRLREPSARGQSTPACVMFPISRARVA